MGKRAHQITMPRALSKPELLKNLQEFADEIGKRPTTREMNEEGPHSRDTYVKHFGSWNEALEAAGFDTSVRYSSMALLNDLTDLEDQLGHRPTTTEMNELSRYNSGVYRDRFGSWDEACSEAGVKSPKQRLFRVSTVALINDLAILSAQLGQRPTQKQMVNHGSWGPEVYRNRFGSWGSAVEILGHDPEPDTSANRGRRTREIPVESLLNELAVLGASVDGNATTTEMNELGAYSYGTYQARFNTWDQALELSGQPLRNGVIHSEQELLDTLRDLADGEENPPTAEELCEKTPHSHRTYQERFGSWNNALQSAGLNIRRTYGFGKVELECLNCGEEVRKKKSHAEKHELHFCDTECWGEWLSENVSGEDNPHWQGGHSTYYGENWTEIRWEARKRDDYTCQSCGVSQEDHRRETGKSLHVHHIRPIRDFDEPDDANELSNVVTLCVRCHKRWEGVPVRPVLA